VLSTLVLLLWLVGAYSLNNTGLDLWVLVGFGIVGYAFRKLAVDPASLIIALAWLRAGLMRTTRGGRRRCTRIARTG
jgi:TctA family transporter